MPLSFQQRPQATSLATAAGALLFLPALCCWWSLPVPSGLILAGWKPVQATDQGRNFGSDVVFTFGPYHQLYTGQ